MRKEFKWKWCNECEAMAVVCPNCGKLVCSDLHDEKNEKCIVCDLAFQYMKLSFKHKEIPETTY